MKKIIFILSIILIVSALNGCANQQPAPNPMCASVKTDNNDTLTYPALNLTVLQCYAGMNKAYDHSCYWVSPYQYNSSWYAAARKHSNYPEAGHTDWRLPTKNELAVLSSCGRLGRDSVWSGTQGTKPNSVYILQDGKIIEAPTIAQSHDIRTLLVRGGTPEASQEVNTSYTNLFVPNERIEKEKKVAADVATNERNHKLQLARDSVVIRMKSAKRGQQASCSTGQQVVSPTVALESLSLTCPSFGDEQVAYFTFGELQNNNWRAAMVNRVPTTAADGYIGVIISILFEKQ